jgi:signal transduction histidine kinase
MIATMTSARDRIGRLDIVIAVIASALAVVYLLPEVSDERIEASVLAVPFFVALAVPVLWRRVAPTGALAAMLGALLLHAAVFGGGIIRCGFVLPVMFILVFAAGARLGRDRALLGLLFALAIGVAVCLTDGKDGAPPEAITFIAPMTLAVWGIGRLVRSRGRLVGELEVRTDQLRHARDERGRLEIATERARLSAELDELLQRRLGALAKLADGGSKSTDPTAAAATLAEIEQQSRRTLDDMRAVVGALRNDDADAPMAPQPTLTHLEALLVRAKGASSRLNVEGNPQALPAGVELSAYRIVEQLLEAVSDAPGVEVSVRFCADALELTVAGDVRRRNEQAIERTRERVLLHHGTLETTTDNGRAQVVVSLPILAAV